jgi:hypothetical protein
MATDVVFFLKSSAPRGGEDLPWPNPTKLIAVDPPAALMCGGTDPRCSSAYSRLYSSLRDSDGRVLPNFLARYAKGIDVGRVAFVGFSAAHGFLNPLARNAADRSAISAYLLLDATFGGGKDGYLSFARDAANGQRLLVTTTSHTGGDDAWRIVWDQAIAMTGYVPERTVAKPPMPEPSGGVYQLGSELYYYRYVDAQGGSELPHWEMHKVLLPVLQAHLLSYWSGWRVPWQVIAGLALAGAGAYAAYRIWRS